MPFDLTPSIAPPGPPPVRDKGDGRPRRQNPVILPCIRYSEMQTREIWRGMYTIRYQIMNLWDPCYVSVTEDDDPEVLQKLREAGLPLVRSTKTGSPTYQDWLRLWNQPGRILPHIQWGGHVESTPNGDGGAGYAAWKLHALTLK